jgi:ribosomal protein S18 acetylase RimI-like enzyme
MDDITIRPATGGDVDRLIAILYDDPPRDLLGLVPDRAKARAVGAVILRHGLAIDLRLTEVAVIDGDAVGLIELRRPGEDGEIGAWSMLSVVARALLIVGPGGLWRYVRYQRARSRVNTPHPPDALYVGELDVHPDFRNRGIGDAMLRHAEETARREGFLRMALTTTTINPAQHLYARHGYRIVDTRLDPAYERLSGIPGRVLMVKDLA